MRASVQKEGTGNMGPALKPILPEDIPKKGAVRMDRNGGLHPKFYGQVGAHRDSKGLRSDPQDLNMMRQGQLCHLWCRVNVRGPLPAITKIPRWRRHGALLSLRHGKRPMFLGT